MNTITKTARSHALRRKAAITAAALIGLLMSGCAPHSQDFLSDIHPDSLSRSADSAD